MEEAELSWTLAEYRQRGVEPPTRIEYDPLACEGEMMTDDEVLEYISDGVRTLKVLADHKSLRLEAVRKSFLADLMFLLSIDRLELEDYNDLIKPETYQF